MKAVTKSPISEIGRKPSVSHRNRNPYFLSVIVPVFNEHAVLSLCISRLNSVLEAMDCKYEIVFIDDGSTDGSTEFLQAMSCSLPYIRMIQLSRNFGKEAAMTAGLDQAKGDAVIIIDADLQDPPELIPDMVAAWLKGADTVLMRRKSRAGETWFKRVSAHSFYRILNWLSDLSIPEDSGDFRLLSRRAVNILRQLPERSRYMKGLFAWIGLPVEIISYDRAPRAAGETKWGFLGLCRLALEGIISFSVVPLRTIIWLGGITAASSVAFGIWSLIKTLLLGEIVSGYPSIIVTVTFLGGVQLISIGILGEYMARIYVEAKQRPIYVIQSEFGMANPTRSQLPDSQTGDVRA